MTIQVVTNMEPRITDKKEVVKYVENYLKEENSFADLTGIIFDICPESHQHSAFVREIAHKMNRTGRFAIKESKNGPHVRYHVWPVPKKTLYERFPGGFGIFVCVLTAVLTVIGERLISREDSLKSSQLNNQLQQSSQLQSSKLDSLQRRVKALEDSLKYRAK